jgi:hypothetical protein
MSRISLSTFRQIVKERKFIFLGGKKMKKMKMGANRSE